MSRKTKRIAVRAVAAMILFILPELVNLEVAVDVEINVEIAFL